MAAARFDVTEQEQLIEAVRKSEGELRQMLDLAPQLINVLGPQGDRLYANRVALSYYGVSLDEWRQRNNGSEVHPDDVDRIKAHIDRSLTTRAAHELEIRLRAGDGTYRWFLVRSNPLRDDQGQLVRWYIACTDIEDRKRAEDKVRDQETELRQVLDLAPQFIAVFGPRLERLFMNRSGLDYFGLTLDEWRDKPPVCAVGHPDDGERIHAQ